LRVMFRNLRSTSLRRLASDFASLSSESYYQTTPELSRANFLRREAREKARKYFKETVLPLDDGIKALKEHATRKFPETVDVAVNLNIDPKQTAQLVRGYVMLPHGSGRSNVRVAVFAKGEKAEEARAAGADIVGDDDLIAQVKGGSIDFDRCVATPDMMPLVGRIAAILGPKGLMPNPKSGTVTNNVAEAVTAAKGGKVDFRTEKAGIIHAPVGKANFPEEHLANNIKTFLAQLAKVKPIAVKGEFISKVIISSTMGPGIRVDLASVGLRTGWKAKKKKSS